MITNMDVTIPSRVAGTAGKPEAGLRGTPGAKGRDIVMARDWNDLNTGVWLVRSSPWARAWLSERWTLASSEAKRHPWAEQLDIQRWYHGHAAEAAEHVALVPQRQLQSYPGSTPGLGAHAGTHGWHPGDWMVHFAGCGDQAGRSCEREFRAYWTKAGLAATEAAEREVAASGVRPFTPTPDWAQLSPPGEGGQPGILAQMWGWLAGTAA